MVQKPLTAEGSWNIADKTAELEGTSPRLITWGVDSSAGLMYWAAGENPAVWPVLVFTYGEDLFRCYDRGMVDFLTRTMRGDFPECSLEDDTIWMRTETVGRSGNRPGPL